MISWVESGAMRTTPPRASADQITPSGSARMHSGRCNPSPVNRIELLSIPKSRTGFPLRGVDGMADSIKRTRSGQRRGGRIVQGDASPPLDGRGVTFPLHDGEPRGLDSAII